MLRPITLFENLRAVPYTPFYLAIARGEWLRDESRLSWCAATDRLRSVFMYSLNSSSSEGHLP